ncbi:hypothetical protein RYA05_06055 [Pseudomonas syringae pv. actinidiae]|nr:hypothetical protein [Pseudomonas syringae pv. actinidiae]
MRNRRLKVLLLGLMIAALPLPAYCFPFIMAGGGASAMPFLMALLSVFHKNRIVIVGATLASLIGYQLWTPPFSELSGVQDKDDTRLAYMMSNEKLIQSRTMGTSTDKQKIDYASALQSNSPLLYVNSGGDPNFPGMSFVELATNTRFLDKNAILISSDGYLSANAASISGLRYVPDTIDDILQRAAKAPQNTHASVPTCADGACVSVALLDGYFYLYSGYPYKKFDDSIAIESLLVPNLGGLKKLKDLTNDGKKPLYIEYFGSRDNPEFLQGLDRFLSQAGITQKRIGVYEEVDKTPDNFGMLSQNFFKTHMMLAFSDIPGLCKHDTEVIMTTNNVDETNILLTNYVLKRCKIINFPVEGMTAHDAMRFIADHAANLDQKKRYVGIYSDKASAFYTGIAMDVLQKHRYNVIGKSAISVDAEETRDINNLYGLNKAFDKLTLTIFGKSIGMDRVLSYDAFSALTAVVSSILFCLFMLAQRSWLMQGLWCMNLVALAYAQFVFFYFPVEKADEPMGLIITIIGIQFAASIIWTRLRRPQQFSKYTSLVWLGKNGFKTPSSILIKELRPATLSRTIKNLGFPIIFRSNEMTRENTSRAISGVYETVVLGDSLDLNKLTTSWEHMKQGGGIPSFVAQPHLEFDQSGVIEAKHDARGRIVFEIQMSEHAEAVTGNADAKITTHRLDTEACLFSDQPLHNQIYRMHHLISGGFVAEFGLKSGKVIWTQIINTPTNNAYLSRINDEPMYENSGFNDEVDEPTPMFVSMINKFMTGINYRFLDGRIVEKRTLMFGLLSGASKIIPNRLLLQLARRSYAHISRNAHRKTPIWQIESKIKLVLVINLLAKLKKRRDVVVGYEVIASDWEHASRVQSPYGNLYQLEPIGNPSAKGRTISLRGRETFASMEYCRVSMTILLAEWMNHLRAAISRSGVDLHAIQYMNVHGLDLSNDADVRGSIHLPDTLDPSVVCRGFRIATGARIQVSNKIAIRSLGDTLEGSEGVTIHAAEPWLELLDFEAKIAKFVIKGGAHRNSHFVQRCVALGIGVEQE